jgi:hypothetical protein
MYKVNTDCDVFYSTREGAQQKCDVFFAVGRITDEQYTELCALIESVYAE